MCYFNQFSKVLKENFNGKFADAMNAPYRFDRYNGMPMRIREIDNRPKQQPVFVQPDEIPVPPAAAVEVEEIDEAPQFEVIDLDAEMERRRKSTADNNPVQSEAEPKPFPQVTFRESKSPRGLVSQEETGKVIEVKAKVTGGNRAQRRAAKAIIAKASKSTDRRKRPVVRHPGDAIQETGKTVDLSNFDIGFRLE